MVTKPTIGQQGWGEVLNAALDELLPKTDAGATYAPLGVKTSDLPALSYVGHGGLGLLFPSDSIEAFRAAASAPGVDAVEFNVTATGDGTLVCIHGPTINTTTSATPTALVADQSSASMSLLEVSTTAQFPWYGTAGHKVRVPVFKQVLAELGNSVVKFPEVKSATLSGAAAPDIAVAAARAIIEAGVVSSTVLCSFHTADLALAAAEGVECCWFPTDVPIDAAALRAQGITWIGVSRGTTNGQAQINAAKAGGLRVMLYTPNRHYEYASYSNYDMLASDDPQYLAGTAQRKTDLFEAQTWYPGMIPATNGSRGTFSTAAPIGSWWGYAQTDDVWRGALHGYLDIDDPTNYTLSLDIVLDAVSTAGRWAAVCFGFDDDRVYDYVSGAASPSGAAGNVLLVRSDGQTRLYRQPSDAGAVQIGASIAGTAPTLGTTVIPISIAVSPTAVVVTAPGGTLNVPLSDTSHRGRYIHLGRYGAAARFKNVLITP